MKCYMIGATVATALFLVVSCLSPPAGTVEYDTNGPLIPGGLVLCADKDDDGEPDRDPNGDVIMIESMSPYYEVAERLDERGPELLDFGNSVTGLSILGIAAALWRKHRLAKMTANLVASFQVGRNALKDGKYTKALAVVDKALSTEQLAKTVDMVTDIKAAMKKEADAEARANGGS